MANSINPDGYGYGLLPGSSSPFWRGDETPKIGALADVQTTGVRDQYVLLYDILSQTWIAKPLIDDDQSSDYTTYSAKKIEELIANIEGGGSGTNDYNQLINKPAVNGITLSGDKSLSDFGIQGKLTAVGYISIDNMNRISVNIPIDDTATDADHLWSAQKIANMLSTKANINAFDNYYTKTQMDAVLDSKVDETEFNELEERVDNITDYESLTNKPAIDGTTLTKDSTAGSLRLGKVYGQSLGGIGSHNFDASKLGKGIVEVTVSTGSISHTLLGIYNVPEMPANQGNIEVIATGEIGTVGITHLPVAVVLVLNNIGTTDNPTITFQSGHISIVNNAVTYLNDVTVTSVNFTPMSGGSAPVDLMLKHTQYVKTAADLGINATRLAQLSNMIGYYATLNVDGIQLSIESGKYAVTFINGKRYFTRVSSVIVDGVTKAQIDIYGEEALAVTPATISITINSIVSRSYTNDWSEDPVKIPLDQTKTNHYIKLSITDTEIINLIDGTTSPNQGSYHAMLHVITSPNGDAVEFTSIDVDSEIGFMKLGGFTWGTQNYTLTIESFVTDLSLRALRLGIPGVEGIKIDSSDVTWSIISEF